MDIQYVVKISNALSVHYSTVQYSRLEGQQASKPMSNLLSKCLNADIIYIVRLAELRRRFWCDRM